LSRGGWSLSDRASAHVSAEKAWNWRIAASEAVLIGVLRAGEELQHLEWIQQERAYYTRLTQQRRLLGARYVALYEPVRITGTSGVVRHWFAINSIDVVRRNAVHTPWTTRRSPDEWQVLYRLGAAQSDVYIENRRSERFSVNRWSSRLAIERANVVEELLLETEPEWRLIEQLRATRQPFSLRSEKAYVESVEDPSGRAWFTVGDRLIQFRGAAGFVLRQPGREETYLTPYELERLLTPTR
jgi:hypothetical protein